MNNNECQHQWVKTLYGHKCSKCSQVILNEQILATPGIIYEDIDSENEEDANITKEEGQSK